MTISSTLNILNTSFGAIGAQSATIASNIANANVAGYSRQIANLGTDVFGGVSVFSVTRDADAALAAKLNNATSDAAAQNAIADGLTSLARTVSDSSTATSTGAYKNGNSPSAMIGNFASALSFYQAQPSSVTAAQAAVDAAKTLAASLNAGSAAVTTVRTQADQNIGKAVDEVNAALQQLKTVNNSIISGRSAGADTGAMEDKRDALVSQIAQQIGINTSINTNGSMSIFTDSGATLYQNAPATLTFVSSGQLGPGATGGQVYVNGQPITGPSANVPVQSGAISGLVQLRDTVAPQYQAQLDQIAGNLVTAFQESDQTGSGAPSLPGLFTTVGATSVPAASNWTGLANALVVNPNVDPSQGGDALRLRDGGISSASNADYVYNATGAASYSGRLGQLAAALKTQMNFAPSAGLASSASLTDYAQTSVGWLQGANQKASANATYQSSLATQAASALNNATGVNLDAELTHMLSIESSYTASAKLLTTANSMLTTLVNAV